jgi:hypothetical protein
MKVQRSGVKFFSPGNGTQKKNKQNPKSAMIIADKKLLPNATPMSMPMPNARATTPKILRLKHIDKSPSLCTTRKKAIRL